MSDEIVLPVWFSCEPVGAGATARLAVYVGEDAVHADRLDPFKERDRKAFVESAVEKEGSIEPETLDKMIVAYLPEYEKKIHKPAKAPKERSSGFALTDTGNADRLIHLHGDKIAFNATSEEWHFYDGKRWLPKARVKVEHLTRDIAGQVLAEMAALVDQVEIESLQLFHQACQSKTMRFNAIDLARSEVARPATDFDVDPWLLNAQNGTIDLRTGDLRPHDPGDLITKIAATEYHPDATCPRWDKFMLEIHDGNQDVVDYIDRWAGYSLTGLDRHQELHILFGNGSNGKNLEMETKQSILGDYASSAEPELFLATKNDKHPAGMADLYGKRSVISSETDEGRKFDQATLKRATGDKIIKARFMHKNFFEYERQFKINLLTNHKPEVSGDDPATWRRLRLIEYKFKFMDPKDPAFATTPNARVVDEGLMDAFKEEWSGILARMIRGCLEWKKWGMKLDPPPCIIQATNEYRDEQDMVKQYLDSNTVRVESDRKIGSTPLYEHYKAWCRKERKTPVAQKVFSADLEKKGYQKQHKRDGNWFFGVAIARAEIVEWLMSILTEQRSARWVWERKDEMGFDKPDVKRAADALGVVPFEAGRDWIWPAIQPLLDPDELDELDDPHDSFESFPATDLRPCEGSGVGVKDVKGGFDAIRHTFNRCNQRL